MAANTKTKIVDTAIKLFNRDGSGSVSTNHIAAEAGISPGNLYYHFDNREEIIRTIFSRMNGEMAAIWQVDPESALSADLFFKALQQVQVMLIGYRFFQRELSTLLRRDPVLVASYRQVRAERLCDLEAFFERMIECGTMRRPECALTLPRLIRAGWIVGDYWVDFLEVEGAPIDATQVEEGVATMFEIVRPYLLDPGAFFGHSTSTSARFRNVDGT